MAYTTDLTGATVNYTLPVATDTQDSAPTVTCTPASGTKFAVGSTTVNCTATDANGNTATTSFPVVVRYSTSANGDTSRHGPGDPVADAGHAGHVRQLHRRRRQGLPGVRHGERDLLRG